MRVRRQKPANVNRPARMSLQLYQVDYKSYLLDFKSINIDLDAESSGKYSSLLQSATHIRLGWCLTFRFLRSNLAGNNSPRTSLTGSVDSIPASSSVAQSHQTMEFFEMCAALISQLAR